MDILQGVWGALVEIIKNSGYAFSLPTAATSTSL